MTLAVLLAPGLPSTLRARDAALVVHRPLRAGQDHHRRHRPRGGLLAGHALPLLRRQARDRAPARSPPSSTASPARRGRRRARRADVRRRRRRGRSSPARGELRGHDALQFLLAHEPEAVLGHLAFGPGDRVLIAVGDAIAPAFDRWLTPTTRPVRATGSRARALVRAHAAPARSTSPTPAAARAFLEQLVIPGLEESRKTMTSNSEHHRSRRRQRPRRDPRHHQHRRRRGPARGPRRCRRHLHVGLRAQPSRAGEALREGQDVAVERQRPAVGHRRRPGEGRARQPEPERHRSADGPRGHAVREVGRQGVDPVRRSSRRTGRCRSSCTASRAR